jgi:hypothetical protein
MDKVVKLRAHDIECYQEFVGFTTQHISGLEERLESLDQWVTDILKLHDKKYQMIKSLTQDLMVKENLLSSLESRVKK